MRLDLSTGTSEALVSPRGRVVADPVFRGDALLLTIDGGAQLVVLVREGDRERRVLVPRGATSVAFASATRFLAAGATADRLWTTLDGGATWTVLDVPVEGDPRAVALDEVVCTNAACTAAPVAWVDPALLAALDHRPPKLVARPR